MNKIILAFSCITFNCIVLSMETANGQSTKEFSYRLMTTNPDQIKECDDIDRWISVKPAVFNVLLENADQQDLPDKSELLELKRKIVRGIVNLNNNKEVLLTQKEFFGGLVQYLPWKGDLLYNPNAMTILLNKKQYLLTLGKNNFWKPNDVQLTTLQP